MAEFAPEMPVKSALVPIGAESVRRCSSVPPMREGAHFGAGLKSPCQHPWRHAITRARSGDDDGDEEMTTDDEPAAPKTRLDPPPLNNPSQTGENSLRLLFKTIVFSNLCVNC